MRNFWGIISFSYIYSIAICCSLLPLAVVQTLIQQRMAELERIRAEEEARLKRIEQLAMEARETRQRCREP